MVLREEKLTWPDRPDEWVSFSKYPLRDDDGAIVGTFGISRDVTRRVRADEDARRHSDRRRPSSSWCRWSSSCAWCSTARRTRSSSSTATCDTST
jgi:PAS domain-containing protein